MKVLALLGSPKSNGNTVEVVDRYLKVYLDQGHEVEKVFLRSLKISPCTACDMCHETGECVIPDDMQEIYTKMDNAQVVIVGTPIYFNSVSSWTKIVIDRCQKYWSKKFVLNQKRGFKNKSGVLICTAGVKHSIESLIGATVVLDLFFKSIDAEYVDTLFVDETDKVPAIDQIEEMNNIETKSKEHIEKISKKHKL